MEYPVQKTESEWRKQLTPEEFHLLRESGTERGGTGKYLYHFEEGQYRCAGCQQVLFASQSKFDSGTGWPSWSKPAEEGRVKYVEDNAFGMRRVEVVCSACGGHLGHVFDDAPNTGGKRY